LHVAVVVLAGPHVAALPLQGRGHHVVDQPVLIGDAGGLELILELGVEDLLEQVFEAPVVALHDRVLGREVDGQAAVESVAHRGAREVADRVVEVVHRHRDTAAGEVVHVELDRVAAVLRREGQRQRPLARHDQVGGAVLVAEGVAADDDRLRPPGHEPRDVGDDDRLAEDDPTEDVADRPVGRAVHLLEAELLDARLVWGDRRALHADAVSLDGVGGVDRDLVVGRVAALDAEVVVLELDVEIGKDQLVLDELPDDPRHLVAVELDDRRLHCDLGHEGLLEVRAAG
jgi:hypothetical protein